MFNPVALTAPKCIDTTLHHSGRILWKLKCTNKTKQLYNFSEVVVWSFGPLCHTLFTHRSGTNEDVQIQRKDHVRTEEIKDSMMVETISMRCERGQLRWLGHVKQRQQECVWRRVIDLALPGNRRQRPQMRWLEYVANDMQSCWSCGRRHVWQKSARGRKARRCNLIFHSIINKAHNKYDM